MFPSPRHQRERWDWALLYVLLMSMLVFMDDAFTPRMSICLQNV
jgi:hypothetical protein